MEWSSITPILYPVAVFCITSALGYIAYMLRRITALIEKHERVLFGDKEIGIFEGIVSICISGRKYSIDDRKAFIALVTILCKDNVISVDAELKEALEQLKKYE